MALKKDVCGAKLYSTAVLAYPVDCDCLYNILDTHYCCLFPNGSLNPPSTSHSPPATLHPLPPTHILIRAICYITVIVEKAAQNPEVFAS